MVTMPLIAHPPTRPRPRVLARFRRFVQQLGPYQSLASLGVPAAVVEPLKIVAVGIAGNGHWLAGTATVVAAYAVSLLFIERLSAIDLETFAELDVRAFDNLPQFGLSPDEWLLANVAAVQIEQVEPDHDDALRLALEFVLQDREIGLTVGGGHDDLAVHHGRVRLDPPGVMSDLLEGMGPIAAPREDLRRLVGQMYPDTVVVELDFVNPAVSGRRLLDRGCQGRLDETGQGPLESDRLGFSTLKRH